MTSIIHELRTIKKNGGILESIADETQSSLDVCASGKKNARSINRVIRIVGKGDWIMNKSGK